MNKVQPRDATDHAPLLPDMESTRRRSSGSPRSVWTYLRRDRWAMVSGAVVLIVVSLAILAPLVSPYGPNEQDLLMRLQPMSSDHWLGTDHLGRDQVSRLIAGARVSLFASVWALSIALVLGVPVGLLAGYRGGWIDAVVGRVSDGFMSVPALVLALAIVAVLGPGIQNAMLAIGFVFAPRFVRITRASTADLRNTVLVEATVGIGCSTPRLLLKHVLPNVASPIIVQASLLLGAGILAEASLSFLGAGARPPSASWGAMIQMGAEHMSQHPHLVIAPGVAILITVVAVQTFADSLRDALGARLSRSGGAS